MNLLAPVAGALLALSACVSQVEDRTSRGEDRAAPADPNDLLGGPIHAFAPGTPRAIAASPDPLALAVDEAFVYWTDGDGSVWRASKDGSGAMLLSPAGGAPAFAIATDAGRVFWATPQAIGEVSKLGGPAYFLATGVAPRDLATDGTSLFFAQSGIRAIPADGGPVASIVTYGGAPLAADSASVLFALPSGTLLRMATNHSTGIQDLGWFSGPIAALALYQGDAYVATGQGALFRVSTSGGGMIRLAKNLPVVRLAVDASGIYATTADSVVSIAFAGGDPVTLADHLRAPRAIALDADSVYWTSDGQPARAIAARGPGGYIMKVAKR